MPRPAPYARRRAHFEGVILPDGQLQLLSRTRTVRQWADELRLSQGTVIARLAFGFTVADALTAMVGTVQTPQQEALAAACEAAEEAVHLGGRRA